MSLRRGADKKVVLVIGAAGGVGESVGQLLSSQGWYVIGTCRSAAQRRALLERGACQRVLQMDLSDTTSMTRAFDTLAADGIAGLDGLVNCAAVTHATPLESESLEEVRRLFEVNLFGSLGAVQLALPALRVAQGRVVLIGSSSGAIGVPMLGAYSASKFALEGLADALRRELAGQGVAVSLVIPGGIRTPMTERAIDAIDGKIRSLHGNADNRYDALYRQHQGLLQNVERLAISPDRVAEVVLKALSDRKPEARYFCGVEQRALRTAVNLLPDSLWDGLLTGRFDTVLNRWSRHASVKQQQENHGMQQLSSFDALMVFAESSRTPMHVSPFFIYDVGTAPGGFVRFKSILKVFEERLSQAPILRRKLLRVPLDLDDPYWADDPEFDLEQHIRHIALPKPGDRRQLSILLARLTAYPMDLTRPAWDAFVIEGLDHVDGVPPGSFGLLLRIHHAAIDGQSGHAVLRAIHDPAAAGQPAATQQPYEAVKAPSTAQMLTRAYRNLLRKPGKIAKVLTDAVPAIGRVQAVKRHNPGEQRPVPPTRFSDKVSSQRVVSLLTFDMDGLRAARRQVEGATINDVVVTVVSGAMRRYLEAKHELPTLSMTSIVPVNVRTESERDTPGNLLSLASVNMHSDIADPLERLRAIHASAVYAKTYHNAVGARVMSDIAESMPAGITSLGARVASAAGLIDKLLGNTIVTNVPGPQQPFFLAGAKAVEFHAVGALLDGLGLFHAVNSYCGRIAITVLADRRMMPDPEFYERCLRESFDEVVAVSDDSSTGKKRSAVKGARAKAVRTRRQPSPRATPAPGESSAARVGPRRPRPHVSRGN